jgi:hypothetical protein
MKDFEVTGFDEEAWTDKASSLAKKLWKRIS